MYCSSNTKQMKSFFVQEDNLNEIIYNHYEIHGGDLLSNLEYVASNTEVSQPRVGMKVAKSKMVN